MMWENVSRGGVYADSAVPNNSAHLHSLIRAIAVGCSESADRIFGYCRIF